ncbi:MAG: beta-lactamase family protein [Armatimonadetes bacterium]|nr:beta-lactamase family protein [Armatimonadota bacterium]MDE2207206.1 beta-lactamase family protein [Armatimonadota bacterium]
MKPISSLPISRRSLLTGTAALAALPSAAQSTSMVTTGAHNPALDSFDRTMISFMRKRSIPGGQLAVTRYGRLVYARGYGFADLERRTPVQPQSLFRIASITKPFTAVAIMTLVQDPRFRLRLDDPAFPMIPLNRKVADPRLNTITIRQLLHHTGGFDRDKSGDPMFRPLEIAAAEGTPAPADQWAIIRWMAGRPLDFDPGTRFAYSNFGYCVLGRVIEAVTAMRYVDYVSKFVLQPMAVRGMRMGRTRLPDRARGEVRYYQPNARPVPSIFPQDHGELVSVCYGAWNLEAMDSHGAWLASAPALVRFAAQLDFPSQPPLLAPHTAATLYEPPAAPIKPEGGAWYGCGWEVRPVGDRGKANTWHNGSLDGTNTWLVRRWDGLAWAALFNQRDTGNGLSDGEIDANLHPAADAVTHWPDYDLFQTGR